MSGPVPEICFEDLPVIPLNRAFDDVCEFREVYVKPWKDPNDIEYQQNLVEGRIKDLRDYIREQIVDEVPLIEIARTNECRELALYFRMSSSGVLRKLTSNNDPRLIDFRRISEEVKSKIEFYANWVVRICKRNNISKLTSGFIPEVDFELDQKVRDNLIRIRCNFGNIITNKFTEESRDYGNFYFEEILTKNNIFLRSRAHGLYTDPEVVGKFVKNFPRDFDGRFSTRIVKKSVGDNLYSRFARYFSVDHDGKRQLLWSEIQKLFDDDLFSDILEYYKPPWGLLIDYPDEAALYLDCFSRKTANILVEKLESSCIDIFDNSAFRSLARAQLDKIPQFRKKLGYSPVDLFKHLPARWQIRCKFTDEYLGGEAKRLEFDEIRIGKWIKEDEVSREAIVERLGLEGTGPISDNFWDKITKSLKGKCEFPTTEAQLVEEYVQAAEAHPVLEVCRKFRRKWYGLRTQTVHRLGLGDSPVADRILADLENETINQYELYTPDEWGDLWPGEVDRLCTEYWQERREVPQTT